MKRLFGVLAVVLTLTALGFAADFEYQKKASTHDLMWGVVKPSMDGLAAMNKAGGPQNDADWKHARAWASVLAESGELLQMDGRVKDDVWTDGAQQVVTGGEAAMQASMGKDSEALKASMGQIGGGCRTCHQAHRKMH